MPQSDPSLFGMGLGFLDHEWVNICFFEVPSFLKICQSGLGILDQRKANMGFFSKMPNLLYIRSSVLGLLGMGFLDMGSSLLNTIHVGLSFLNLGLSFFVIRFNQTKDLQLDENPQYG